MEGVDHGIMGFVGLVSIELHVENNLEVEVLSIIERKARPVTGSGREPSR